MRKERLKRQQLRRSASRLRKKSVKKLVKKNSTFSKELMRETKVAARQEPAQPVRSQQLKNSKENKRRSKLSWKKKNGMLKNWRQKKEVMSNKKLQFSNKSYYVL